VIAVNDKAHLGTAFFYSDQMFMITCEHVIHGLNEVLVSFPFHNIISLARVVNADPSVDLAILELTGVESDHHGLPYLKLAPQANTGDLVFAGGFSADGNYHFTDGQVSNTDNPHVLVVTNLTDHGTSGGPCVGRGFRNLVGVIKSDFGVAHHRTQLIPFFDVDNYVKRVQGVPQFEIFRV
jgi:S1-C subfamily serine protease